MVLDSQADLVKGAQHVTTEYHVTQMLVVNAFTTFSDGSPCFPCGSDRSLEPFPPHLI